MELSEMHKKGRVNIEQHNSTKILDIVSFNWVYRHFAHKDIQCESNASKTKTYTDAVRRQAIQNWIEKVLMESNLEKTWGTEQMMKQNRYL